MGWVKTFLTGKVDTMEELITREQQGQRSGIKVSPYESDTANSFASFMAGGAYGARFSAGRFSYCMPESSFVRCSDLFTVRADKAQAQLDCCKQIKDICQRLRDQGVLLTADFARGDIGSLPEIIKEIEESLTKARNREE